LKFQLDIWLVAVADHADHKGFKKGNLSEALEEAIDLWIMEQAKRGKAKTK
jgi:hypothetical protein